MAAAGAVVATASPAEAGPGCPDIAILAVPGSHQGLANGDSFGGGVQVDSVLGRVRHTIDTQRPRASYSIEPIDYPAQLNLGWNVVKTINNYNASKDQGYSTTYESLSDYRDCKNTKVILAGFSQGAQIVGDLVNTIARTNNPIPSSKLLGAVLISDPGFNPGSPGATRIGFGVGLGVAGPRPAFPADFPVKSVCLRGDLVCDNPARTVPPRLLPVAAGPLIFAELRNHDHESRYQSSSWPGTGKSISEYLGDYLSQRVLAVTAP